MLENTSPLQDQSSECLKAISEMKSRTEALALSLQDTSGAWIGEVELNPGTTAQIVMLHAALHIDFPGELKAGALNYIRSTQREDGGWNPHHGAPSEVSLTTECYIALRLLGVDSKDSACQRALAKIESLGGVSQCNAWTQLYMAVMGIIPWQKIYRTPVEIMLMPNWFPVKLSQLSYWVRVITIPMALLGAVGPGEPITQARILAKELNVRDAKAKWLGDNLVLKVARLFSSVIKKMFPGLRKIAMTRALNWIEQIREAHGDFGGNTCTGINVLLCLDRLGQRQDKRFQPALDVILGYALNRENQWRVQCCQSHIWDTGFMLSALSPKSERVQTAALKGTEWLTSQQITDVRGPWSKNVDALPGGWCFGDRHKHFPVTDCSAISLIGLDKHQPDFHVSNSAELGVKWLCEMQHHSGGWSAYEKYQDSLSLNIFNRFVKFKDIEDGLVDVPKADVTAKVVEALARWRGTSLEVSQALVKARKFLLEKRNHLGLWRGNYGVNFLYGSAFSARALREIDLAPTPEWANPLRKFLLEKQNADGGWGEAEASYRDLSLIGVGESSPVQTSWALMSLCACYAGTPQELSSLERAIKYLKKTQRADGNWSEPNFLGTVFPNMVYFRYEYYTVYFPLLALEASEKILAQ